MKAPRFPNQEVSHSAHSRDNRKIPYGLSVVNSALLSALIAETSPIQLELFAPPPRPNPGPLPQLCLFFPLPNLSKRGGTGRPCGPSTTGVGLRPSVSPSGDLSEPNE